MLLVGFILCLVFGILFCTVFGLMMLVFGFVFGLPGLYGAGFGFILVGVLMIVTSVVLKKRAREPPIPTQTAAVQTVNHSS
eukprot:m.313442 g.313442  ORF g.313442 m.313442 type:complete len:81 (+) comp399446_c0_seq1:113-355(+)